MDRIKQYSLKIDFINSLQYKPINLVQYDAKGADINMTLTSNKIDVDLTDCTVQVEILKVDKTVNVTQLTEITGNVATFTPDINDVVCPGKVLMTVTVYKGDGKSTSIQLFYNVKVSLIQDDSVTSTTAYPALDSLISQTTILNSDITTAEGLRVIAENARGLEVSNARGTFPTLQARQDNVDVSLADKTNHFNSQAINVLFPPSPLVAVKGNANYLSTIDHKYYTNSGCTILADDDTATLQAIVNATPLGGTIFIPCKCHITTEILIPRTMNIIGNGKYNSGICNDGVGNTLRVLATIERGTIRDIAIMGNDTALFAPNSTTLSGIVFEGAYIWYLNNIWMRGHGEHGIKFNGGNWTNTIDKCEIEYNKIDGIYMVAYGGGVGGQINATSITNCHLAGNGRNGLSLWGTNLNVKNNIIEGNHNSGILMSSDQVTVPQSATGINIEGNYFELDGDGFINVKVSISPLNAITFLTIKGNYGTLDGSKVNSGVLYTCNFIGVGTLSSTGLQNLQFINNSFGGTGIGIANFNNLLDYKSKIESLSTNTLTQMINFGGATVIFKKFKTISGYFYCKGFSYTGMVESDALTIGASGLFPVGLSAMDLITQMGIYVDTDHTAFTIRFQIYFKNCNDLTTHTALFNNNVSGTTSGYIVTNTLDYYGVIDGERLIYPRTDCYVKITVYSASGGTSLKLGNLLVQYC